jgi:hypothetical protein
VYVPLDTAAAARAPIVLAASRLRRLIELSLIDLPYAARAGEKGERHRAADGQEFAWADNRHAAPRAWLAVVARGGASETRSGEAAIGAGPKVDRPPRAVAARAVDMQLKAVAGYVAYRLERKRAEHGANRNAAARHESQSQQ